MYVCVCVCVYTHVYTHAHMYTCTHIYIYVYKYIYIYLCFGNKLRKRKKQSSLTCRSSWDDIEMSWHTSWDTCKKELPQVRFPRKPLWRSSQYPQIENLARLRKESEVNERRIRERATFPFVVLFLICHIMAPNGITKAIYSLVICPQGQIGLF